MSDTAIAPIRPLPRSWTWVREVSVSLFHDRAVRQAIGIVVGLRLALGVIAWGTTVTLPPNVVGGDWLQLQVPQSDHLWALIQPWQHWDALWYQHIAMSWYTMGDVHFFPLYPALMRGMGLLLGGGSTQFALGGLLVSTAAFAAALVFLHRLVSADFSAEVADRSMFYIAVSPVAFFFLAPFTEALFLALTVAAVLAARRRAWFTAAIVAAGAAVTRPTGILILVPLLIELGIDVVQRRRRGLFPLRWEHVFAIGLPIWAIGTYYIAYLLPVGGFTASEAPWGAHSVAPWTSLLDSFHVMTTGAHPEEPLNFIFALLLLFSVPFMLWRLPWSYTGYAAVSVVPVLFREAIPTPLAAAARYVLVVFPLFVLMALAGRRVWVDRLVTVMFPVLLAFELILFERYFFVG